MDLGAWGMVDKPKKSVCDKMLKRIEELNEEDFEYKDWPKDVIKFIDKYLPSHWSTDDGDFPVGFVDIPYGKTKFTYEDDAEIFGNGYMDIDLSKIPKGVKKIRVWTS